MRGACCYIAAATAVLVSGCDQASDPSPSSGPAGTPAYDFSKGPASAGPVVRFQGHYVTFLTDVDANLTVIVGTPNRIDEFCGPGDIDVEPVDVQLVFNPTGALHEVDLGSNLPVLVYGAATPVFDVCNDLVGAPLLATGTGHMVYLDNSTGGGPGAHRWGVVAQGTLAYTAGRSGRFSASERFIVSPKGLDRRVQGLVHLH